jgi:queuine tRNA-ribosyltransferase
VGVDLFDCVLPTRLARNGAVWSDIAGGRIDLGQRASLRKSGPIMPGCDCLACTDWPVGALAALYQARESLVFRLASMHNLTVLRRVLDEMRKKVLYTA